MNDYIKYRIRLFIETLKYIAQKPDLSLNFHIVSCEKNAGEYALKCLDSVYNSKWDKKKIKHIFIDDASDDNTPELIKVWIQNHKDSSVQYIRNNTRAGLCKNNYNGFKLSKPGDICIELNGDDWFPDENVLDFLAKVYADPDVWITYNTYFYSDGRMGSCRYFSGETIKNNAFREQTKWLSSHLHSFKAELFYHLKPEDLINPETGVYWESAVDKAFYYPMFELAGFHSRHLCRKTYIYNFRELSHENLNKKETEQRAEKIAAMKKYLPLKKLAMPEKEKNA